MRADKTKPRRRHIRLQNGAHPATPVRDPNKTSLFEVPLCDLSQIGVGIIECLPAAICIKIRFLAKLSHYPM